MAVNLQILGSSSKGNCYILSNDTEALIIEVGVKFSKIKEAVNFNISKIVGVLLSHAHL
ncbi:MAG TPA: MBL fold metallo-hydrolase [bacterium]|nr:MBL fold metallo-hydrolase [bacterium]